MTKKVLIIENEKTNNELIISGSYWFRIEMAYGLKRLGYTPSLVQHPSYNYQPWINGEKLPSKRTKKGLEDIISDYDLVILLDDIEVKGVIKSRDTPIIYWDIEGFPPKNKFFENILVNINDEKFSYYGKKFNSVTNVLEKYCFHFKKQKLKYWEVDAIFSASKKSLFKNSKFLPLGAEPELYSVKNLVKRDINFAIIGSTSRWFQAEERIKIAEIDLKELNFPITYWFGAMPEIHKNNMPKNCFPMGHIDFLSLPNYLQRIKTLLHIPRPYHLETICQSATIYQAAAAGCIVIHHFSDKNLDANKIGYDIKSVNDLDILQGKEFPEDFTYRTRFETMSKMVEVL